MKLNDVGEGLDEEGPIAVGANDVAAFVSASGDVPDGTRWTFDFHSAILKA